MDMSPCSGGVLLKERNDGVALCGSASMIYNRSISVSVLRYGFKKQYCKDGYR